MYLRWAYTVHNQETSMVYTTRNGGRKAAAPAGEPCCGPSPDCRRGPACLHACRPHSTFLTPLPPSGAAHPTADSDELEGDYDSSAEEAEEEEPAKGGTARMGAARWRRPACLLPASSRYCLSTSTAAASMPLLCLNDARRINPLRLPLHPPLHLPTLCSGARL